MKMNVYIQKIVLGRILQLFPEIGLISKCECRMVSNQRSHRQGANQLSRRLNTKERYMSVWPLIFRSISSFIYLDLQLDVTVAFTKNDLYSEDMDDYVRYNVKNEKKVLSSDLRPSNCKRRRFWVRRNLRPPCYMVSLIRSETHFMKWTECRVVCIPNTSSFQDGPSGAKFLCIENWQRLASSMEIGC